MSFLPLLLIALGVSADAFAVSVGKGLTMRRLHLRTAAVIAVAFGLAQGLMPLIGWALGRQLERFIAAFDHWVAFGLLALVGVRMLRQALTDHDGGDDPAGAAATTPTRLAVRPRELLLLAVATSIDAMAVGISLALVHVNIVAAAALIGGVTFLVSFAGVVLGYRAGARWRRPAEVAGGLILIGIGVKILVDHLGLL